MDLKENERIDDLEFKGLKIIQNKNGFCFGIDIDKVSLTCAHVFQSCTVHDKDRRKFLDGIYVSEKTTIEK